MMSCLIESSPTSDVDMKETWQAVWMSAATSSPFICRATQANRAKSQNVHMSKGFLFSGYMIRKDLNILIYTNLLIHTNMHKRTYIDTFIH